VKQYSVVVEQKETLEAAIRRLGFSDPAQLRNHTVFLNGTAVHPEDLQKTVIKQGDLVAVLPVVQGG